MRFSPRALAGAAIAVAAISCGEVPTLPDGIAYISALLLPAPAVAFGDTLRDSTGRAAPLRVVGIGAAGDTIPVTPDFVVTSLPRKGIVLSKEGIVVGDSVRTVQIVAQVGGRLQTPVMPLDVVPQPDSIAPTGVTRSKIGAIVTDQLFALSDGLAVTVTSGAVTPRAAVRSIIVKYAITRIFPANATIPDTTVVLIDESSRFSGTTGRTSADTTDGTGSASRRLRAVPFGFDSVEIQATANNLKGIPLHGSPIRFIVTTK